MQIRVIRVPVSFVGRQGDPALYVVEGPTSGPIQIELRSK
jgi:hypothetical protein